ncbi:hypothetical protein SteCoe_10065 [Stentor coeruleus]|uniref:Uncharacterized protein n=1 Tax=Stentor coeruleus TaxID=5963 RepID=A0A1R2CGK9_9CILI|nr:hypothetical protein SteCoe_10065 [Stentor coeruleus]
MKRKSNKDSKEQLRYKNEGSLQDVDINIDDQLFPKCTDESIVIHLESPQSVTEIEKPKKISFKSYSSEDPKQKPYSYDIFTEDYIRSIPQVIIKQIFNIRRDCINSFSKETKLLSENNKLKGNIRNLNEKIETLTQKILDIEEENIQTLLREKKLAIKPIKSELKTIHNEKENLMQENTKQKETIESMIKNQGLLEETQHEMEKNLKSQEKKLRKYKKICEDTEINDIVNKLKGLEMLNEKYESLEKYNDEIQEKLKEIEKSYEIKSLECINLEKERDVMSFQIKSAEEHCKNINLRAETLEKMLTDKDRLHQDLLTNFKLLQDEIQRISKPNKDTTKSYTYDINSLKSSLAQKLIQKANRN